VVHSDKIDVSLSIRDFSVLAGTIDRTSLKEIKRALLPNQPVIMKVWQELEIGNGVAAELLISSMKF
jgi:hypothetical protein